MAVLKNLPEGADAFDLGAARAARAEVRQGKSFVKLAAGFVEVQPEVPLVAAFAFKDENIKEGLAALLVDPADVDALLADGLTDQDVRALVVYVSGNSLGE